MEYHKPWLNKSYFGLWFLHLEVMKLEYLMHILLLFPVSLGPASALREKGGKKSPIFLLPNPPLGSHRSPIFSPFDPVYLPFSFTADFTAELVPGYFLWFYVSVGVCGRIWYRMPFIVEPVFLWPLWNLKLFSTAKKPFVTKILVDFLFSEISGSEKLHTCSCPWMWWFSGSLTCLTTGPKAKQSPSFTWCSDLRVTANQVIFHTFREKHVASIHDFSACSLRMVS